MIYELKNECLEVKIDSKGAEIKSVVRDGSEYMWCGDPKYWSRTSPVLFPFVGSVNNGKYRVNDKEYTIGQHGFARDMEFEMESATEDSITFVLRSDKETLCKYPFMFELRIRYTIKENHLTVAWEVKNTDSCEISFSIGAHPAFMCPIKDGSQSDHKFRFNTDEDIKYYLLKDGLVDKSEEHLLKVRNGYATIDKDLFDRDALIVEGKQASEISLCTPDCKPYVTVRSEAPLFGLWSPAGKNAPFICIEPWYGRCDAVGFEGDLFEREYSNALATGKSFDTEYTVEFNSI